jgi:hypothetical protein
MFTGSIEIQQTLRWNLPLLIMDLVEGLPLIVIFLLTKFGNPCGVEHCSKKEIIIRLVSFDDQTNVEAVRTSSLRVSQEEVVTCRVHQEDIDFGAGSVLGSLVGHLGRVLLVATLVQGDVQAVAMRLQLLHSSRTEGVTSRHHHLQ